MKVKVKGREAEERLAFLQASVENRDQTIAQLMAQNDWLVTELHHRIKNNLQIVNSLINSQLSYVSDPGGRMALETCGRRFYALSLIHQKLFQTREISSIEVPCYIAELSGYLSDEYRVQGRVRFNYDMVPLSLDISMAIPLGFIVNEILTNALTYAFPAGRQGSIRIGLYTDDEVYYRLTIADDGVGLPEELDFITSKSLGSNLITGLTGQLKGALSVVEDGGLQITLNFKAEGAASHLSKPSQNTIA